MTLSPAICEERDLPGRLATAPSPTPAPTAPRQLHPLLGLLGP